MALLLGGCNSISGSARSSFDTPHNTTILNAYLGQTPPGKVPHIFAPEKLSVSGENERVLAFSVDGKEIYFSKDLPSGLPTILYFKQVDNIWQDAIEAPFLINHSHGLAAEPFMAPQGDAILFVSATKNNNVWEVDIWKSVRNGDTWQQPEKLSSAINSDKNEWHPCIVENGNIYFARLDDDQSNIYFARHLGNGRYAESVPIIAINSSHKEWDPYVDPQENYMIFKSNKPGGKGSFDSYISYRRPDGSWSESISLEAVNTNRHDEAGEISPDGKYYFFSRYESDGTTNVYWVDADSLGIINF